MSEFFPTFSVEVYNRWGTKVFEDTHPNSSWTGEGEHNGIYFYHIRAKDYQGKLFTAKGSVSLLG